MGVGRGTQGCILKILAEKGCFLSFQWEKTNITTFPPRRNFEKSPSAPPGKILPTPIPFYKPCVFHQ